MAPLTSLALGATIALAVTATPIYQTWNDLSPRAEAGQAATAFQVYHGGYDNFFHRDNVTAAQVLFTSPNDTSKLQRFLAAFPAGNSGALMYFLPQEKSVAAGAAPLSVQLVDGKLEPTTAPNNNTGVSGNMSFNANATVGVTVLGSIRTVRDYVEGKGTMHEIFNYTVTTLNSSHIELHRTWINGTHSMDLTLTASSDLSFSVTPSNNGSFTPPKIDVVVPEGKTGTARWTVVCNETTTEGLEPHQLFLTEPRSDNQPALATALQGLADSRNPRAKEVSFLATTETFFAGGWRFLTLGLFSSSLRSDPLTPSRPVLTYFGRDQLITLRLLMPLLTSEAIEASIGSVIQRTNTTGALAHEETIGEYASFVNINEGHPELGATPNFDYKMVDTDFLLLPVLSHYFLQLPQGQDRASDFFARNSTLHNGTFAELVQLNIQRVLDLSEPFSKEPVYQNFIRIRPDVPVGNWRDSNDGLGWGVYPYDVQASLVPSSLRAIESLSKAGIVNKKYAKQASAQAAAWETHAARLFEVTVPIQEIESRVQAYTQHLNLSQSLLYGEGSLNDTAVEPLGPKTFDTKTFYALALREDGSTIEILHSDVGFNLLYNDNISEDMLWRIIEALAPYPRGLLTNVGMVVANPAMDTNTTNYDTLNRGAYHGSVTWSWTQALMAAGLARQIGFCDPTAPQVDVNVAKSNPAWCKDDELVSALKRAQTLLWSAINGAKEERFVEVFSWDFDANAGRFSPTDLARFSPDGTESDAIQLWSYGFLALADPTAA